MRHFFFLFFTFFSFFAHAQNATHTANVDDNLIAVFPFRYTIKESDSSKVFTCTGVRIEFIISRQVSRVADRSKEEFNSSMKTFRQVWDSLGKPDWNFECYNFCADMSRAGCLLANGLNIVIIYLDYRHRTGKVHKISCL